MLVKDPCCHVLHSQDSSYQQKGIADSTFHVLEIATKTIQISFYLIKINHKKVGEIYHFLMNPTWGDHGPPVAELVFGSDAGQV